MKFSIHYLLINWNFLFSLLLSSLFFRHSNAQGTPYFSFPRENFVLINPSFLNHQFIEAQDREKRTYLLNISHRQQYLGVRGGPIQPNIRFENILPIDGNKPSMKWGVGLEGEKIGDFNNVKLFGNYAYFITSSKELLISMGLTLKAGNQYFKASGNRDNPDYVIEGYPMSSTFFNSSVGLFVKKSGKRNSKLKNFYAGLSFLDIADIQFPISEVAPVTFNTEIHFLGGFSIELNKGYRRGNDITLEPLLWARYVPGFSSFLIGSEKAEIPLSADFSLRLNIENFFLGTGIGTSGNILVELGLAGGSSTKNYNFRYGLMLNLPVIVSRNFRFSSLEVFINYAFDR
jgi:hypothetical protein